MRRRFCLRSGAAPGPSGFRNRHLLIMLQSAFGIDTVANFAHIVADGKLSGVAHTLWHAAILEPVDQGEQNDGSRKVRPIGLGEALLKFSETVALDMAEREIKLWLEPAQRGIATPDGVVQVIRIMRGWAKDMQDAGSEAVDECLVSTDLQNAFCNFYRHGALATLRDKCPNVARMMAGHWSTGVVYGWQRVAGCGWQWVASERGGWQGSRATMVAYAVDAEAAFRDAGLQHVSRIGITDDFYLAGNIANIASKWPDLESSLEYHGHCLRRPKCSFWVPALDVVSVDDITAEAKAKVLQLESIIPRTHGGLQMLGSAAQGKWRAAVGSTSLMGKAAMERAEAAVQTCKRAATMASLRLAAGSVQAAWVILQKSASRALDYDSRLCPPEALAIQRTMLTDAMQEAANAILGRRLSVQSHEQMQLPGRFGGMSYRDVAADQCAAGYWAAWKQHRQALPSIAAALGRPLRGEVDAAEAAEVAEVLRKSGVEVEADVVQFTPEAAIEYANGPWVHDTPLEQVFQFTGEAGEVRDELRPQTTQDKGRSRVCGRICRGIQALRASRLWSQMDTDAQTALLSSGGPGAGQLWNMVPHKQYFQLHNACFRTMAALKLDLVRVPLGCTCHLPLAGQARKCGKHLDRKCRHVDLCNSAGRERAHASLRRSLASKLGRAGAMTDEEVVIPDLCHPLPEGGCSERIMDVVAAWPASSTTLLFDVTVRSSWAKRYANTDADPGSTGRKADAEKVGKYGCTVHPVAFQTLGRLSKGGMQALEVACAEAKEWGRHLSARDLRLELEFVVLRAGAQSLLRALGGGFEAATGHWSAVVNEDADLPGSRPHLALGEGPVE